MPEPGSFQHKNVGNLRVAVERGEEKNAEPVSRVRSTGILKMAENSSSISTAEPASLARDDSKQKQGHAAADKKRTASDGESDSNSGSKIPEGGLSMWWILEDADVAAEYQPNLDDMSENEIDENEV
jgi:hypothetical protein